jgi:F-type H+-transporting ATPase subunit gamma
MPSLKEVRNRIKSVQSTQQITKAMKMVAAAKLRKAQDATIQLRPYSKKLNEILSNLSSNSEAMADSPFTQVREIKKVLIVVITSDRGLCGPFNTNILKAGNSLIFDRYAEQHKNNNVTFLCIGKRGLEYFSKKHPNVIAQYSTIFQKLSFDAVKEAAQRAMDGFVKGEFDTVELVYNEFKNVATQIIRKDQWLPVAPDAIVTTTETKTSNTDYIFEPSADVILNELIPKSLMIKFYRAVLESNASEHGARMTAMDKATENAGDMLKDLKVSYNRSRQASITKEILEIVGGAEALAAK